MRKLDEERASQDQRDAYRTWGEPSSGSATPIDIADQASGSGGVHFSERPMRSPDNRPSVKWTLLLALLIPVVGVVGALEMVGQVFGWW